MAAPETNAMSEGVRSCIIIREMQIHRGYGGLEIPAPLLDTRVHILPIFFFFYKIAGKGYKRKQLKQDMEYG